MASQCPAADGSCPKTKSSTDRRRCASTWTSATRAVMDDLQGLDHLRARRGRRAEDGQQLRLPLPLPLLRRHRLPPDHPRFRRPGRRPDRDRAGGPGYRFEDELPKAGRYEIGSLAMANAGPNTNGSQFFIISGPSGVQLPPAYSLFGKAVTGLEVISALEAAGTSSGRPSRAGGDRVGDDHRGGLSDASSLAGRLAGERLEAARFAVLEDGDAARRRRASPRPVGLADHGAPFAERDEGAI